MPYEAASYSYIFMAVIYAVAFIVVGTFMVLRGKRRSERDQIRRLNQLEEMARMRKKKADGDLKDVKEEDEGEEEETGGSVELLIV